MLELASCPSLAVVAKVAELAYHHYWGMQEAALVPLVALRGISVEVATFHSALPDNFLRMLPDWRCRRRRNPPGRWRRCGMSSGDSPCLILPTLRSLALSTEGDEDFLFLALFFFALASSNL